MRIAFFWTGEFSASILAGILDVSDLEIVFVVSQPDKPVGRKKELLPTPVKSLAVSREIEVWQPETLKKKKDDTRGFGEIWGAQHLDIREKLISFDLDFIVVVAYGKIIPKKILWIPKYGCINLHGSILPLYRGASPIQESLKQGDTETGLTVMYMSAGMDEGDILKIGKVSVDIVDKTPDIFEKFIEIGPKLLLESLREIIARKLQGTPQDDTKASYCSKIEKHDGYVDFSVQSAKEIYDLYRAYTPWPGIFSYYKEKKFAIEDCFFDESTIVFDDDFSPGDVVEFEDHGEQHIGVLCREGILILHTIKLEWKKSMDILSFVRGNGGFLDHHFSKHTPEKLNTNP